MKKVFKFQLLLFILINFKNSYSQDFFINDTFNSDGRYWVEFGLGSAQWIRENGDKNDGLSLYSSINYSKLTYKYKAYIMFSSEFDIFSFVSPREEYFLLGAMFGRRTKGDFAYISANAGIGLMYAQERGDKLLYVIPEGIICDSYFNKIQYVTINVPVELTATITGNNIGTDLKIYGFLDMKRPIYGVMLTLYLGKLYD